MTDDPPAEPSIDAVEYDATVHEAVLESPEEYPDGWAEQAAFREEHDLPPFYPPRFVDGTRVDAVLEELRERHGIAVDFVVRDLDAGWAAEIDGERTIPVDRYRDDASNTVIGHTASEFERRVLDAVRDR